MPCERRRGEPCGRGRGSREPRAGGAWAYGPPNLLGGDGADGLGKEGDEVLGGDADVGEGCRGGPPRLGVQGATEGRGVARVEPLKGLRTSPSSAWSIFPPFSV